MVSLGSLKLVGHCQLRKILFNLWTWNCMPQYLPYSYLYPPSLYSLSHPSIPSLGTPFCLGSLRPWLISHRSKIHTKSETYVGQTWTKWDTMRTCTRAECRMVCGWVCGSCSVFSSTCGSFGCVTSPLVRNNAHLATVALVANLSACCVPWSTLSSGTTELIGWIELLEGLSFSIGLISNVGYSKLTRLSTVEY